MSLPRFWIADLPHHHAVSIEDPREVHHAAHVLRLQIGDGCTIFDGRGCEARGRITGMDSQRIIVAIERMIRSVNDRLRSVTLIQALPKVPAFETILRQATELGVTRVQPAITDRSVVRIASSSWPHKRDRWARILREASKQSQRADVPELLSPRRWEACLDQHLSGGLAIMLTLAISAPPLSVVLPSTLPDRVVICIGPEGDFTKEEVELFRRRGGLPASLGPRILRAETAPLAALAIMQHEWSRSEHVSS